MLNTRYVAAALATAVLSLPALAGSWPNLPARKAKPAAADCCAPASVKEAVATSSEAKSLDGFAYIGGERGWELVQHKFVLKDGRFAHSDECDHAIRTVSGPTPAESEKTKALSPG